MAGERNARSSAKSVGAKRDFCKLKIGCLQFAAQVGKTQENIERAERVLARDMKPDIDWIVMPEMAISGYNFLSQAEIKPYLEPTAAGITTQWAKTMAKRYGCIVTVGYPEAAKPTVFLSQEAVDILGDFVSRPSLNNCIPWVPRMSTEQLQSFKTFLDETTASSRDDYELVEKYLLKMFGDKSDHEINESSSTSVLLLTTHDPVPYNSLITVNPAGDVLGHSRKSHLYYTDETWAQEGPGLCPLSLGGLQNLPASCSPLRGGHFCFDIYVDSDLRQGQHRVITNHTSKRFFSGNLPKLGRCAFGICMDINPYRFIAPYSAYEFASSVVEAGSSLICISMAWLTLLSEEGMLANPVEPDEQTLLYWAERFEPIRQATSGNDTGGDKIVICANRCGVEGPAVYAGSSAVFRFSEGRVFLLDFLGRNEEKLMVVDLNQPNCAEVVSRANAPASS